MASLALVIADYRETYRGEVECGAPRGWRTHAVALLWALRRALRG